MATLARLKQETAEARMGRRVFLSSAPVSAYKVAHNQKQLLSGEYPLALALPASGTGPLYGGASTGARGGGGSISLLEAFVGPELRWDLTAVNHVMRTVSKHGQPTYLFAGIMDTDPQAFVAVTFYKRTPPDELEHLESVLSRVCQLHVADTKPMQVPGPDQVVASLGKGLMKMLLGGGGGSGSKHRDTTNNTTSATTATGNEPYASGSGAGPYGQPGSGPDQQERERAEYLASLERGPGQGMHVVGPDSDRAYYKGRAAQEDEGEDVPTAPVMPRQPAAMGFSSRREAEARLSALKAELHNEVPSAPDVSAARQRGDQPEARSSAASASSAYPSIPGAPDTASSLPYGRRDHDQQQPWQQHAAGTLSNPFTGSRGVGSHVSAQGPPAPHTMSYEDYLQREEAWGGGGSAAAGRYVAVYRGDGRGGCTGAAPPAGPAPGSDPGPGGYAYGYSHGMADWDARLDQASGEAALRGVATGSGTARGPYAGRPADGQAAAGRDRDRDGGWGGASAGSSDSEGEAPSRLRSRVKYAPEARTSWEEWQRVQREAQLREERQQQQRKGGGAPDWLENLGRVFAGGPAYAGPAYAPNL